MSTKYYKVLKENFLWEVGAIISDEHTTGGGKKAYGPINDIWKKENVDNDEVISAPVVENCPEYFERVYPVNLLTKVVYKAKDEAKALFAKEYTE